LSAGQLKFIRGPPFGDPCTRYTLKVPISNFFFVKLKYK